MRIDKEQEEITVIPIDLPTFEEDDSPAPTRKEERREERRVPEPA